MRPKRRWVRSEASSSSSAARTAVPGARLKAAGVRFSAPRLNPLIWAENRRAFRRGAKEGRHERAALGHPLSPDEPARPAAIGYPVLVRPSYVLGGRRMEIVYDDALIAQSTSIAH